MKHIVITGSTRGIGFGLAESFLEKGCSVTVSGRKQSSVDEASAKLREKYGAKKVFGFPCDVRDYEAVKLLWDETKSNLGHVDVWVNNAGFSGAQMAVWEIPPSQARAVIETNLLGVIYGSMVAVEGMLEQGYGSLYNMEGMGSDGRMHDGLALYGTTKYGLRYFTDSLVQETGDTSLIVGSLRPGMVITDMIVRQYDERPEEWERAKRIFNIIADRIETVTPWLAEQILANQKSGARITWLSRGKLLMRFLTSPFHPRHVVD